MPISFLLAGSLGGLVAFIFSIPAIVIELIEHGRVRNAPLIVDAKSVLGRKLKHREAFMFGLLLHMVMGFIFGVAYVFFVENGWLLITGQAYGFFSLLLFSLLIWMFVSVVVYPLLRMGFFARREGTFVWLETLVSYLLLGSGFWILVYYMKTLS